MVSFDGSDFCTFADEGISHRRIFCSKLTSGQRITGPLNLTAILVQPNVVVNPITIVGHELYLVLDKNAPNKHVVAVDINNPNEVLNPKKSIFNIY